MDRPISMPVKRVDRPFSSSLEPGVTFQPKKVLQSAALASIPEDDLRRKLYHSKDVRYSGSTLKFGKSINNSCAFDDIIDDKRGSILSIAKVMDSMPQPKVPKKSKAQLKEEAAAAAGAGGDDGAKKKKKGKKVVEEELPQPAPWT